MAIKPIRFDSRRRSLVLAIGLLLAAILVAAAMLTQGTTTKVYLVANRDLSAGSPISPADVSVAELNLGSQGSRYLSTLSPGQVLSSSVPAGELIPTRSTVLPLSAGSKSVRVSPSQPLSTRTRIGSLVQLWFVPKQISANTEAVAVQLLGNAEVLAIHAMESTMGRQIDDVELAVPAESLTAVITAIASAGYVSVVPET